MGVLDGLPATETDARPTEDRTAPVEISQLDPFLHEYVTEPYSVESETITQVLTGVIAVSNLMS